MKSNLLKQPKLGYKGKVYDEKNEPHTIIGWSGSGVAYGQDEHGYITNIGTASRFTLEPKPEGFLNITINQTYRLDANDILNKEPRVEAKYRGVVYNISSSEEEKNPILETVCMVSSTPELNTVYKDPWGEEWIYIQSPFPDSNFICIRYNAGSCDECDSNGNKWEEMNTLNDETESLQKVSVPKYIWIKPTNHFEIHQEVSYKPKENYIKYELEAS